MWRRQKRRQRAFLPRGQGGTTLLELLVCTAMLGLFCAASVAVIGPCSRMLAKLQNQNRGQVMAGVIVEDLRRETLHAQGPVRFATAGTAPGAEKQVFWPGTENALTAIEFVTESGYVKLIDAGVVPPTALYQKAERVGSIESGAGTLHSRYYTGYTVAEGRLQYPFWEKARGGYFARAYAEAHPAGFYGGNQIELKFLDLLLVNEGKNIAGVTVEVTVKDAAGATLGSRKAVLDFDNRPPLAPLGS